MINDDSWQSKGGKARDKALTDEQKKQIAFMGAAARWADRPLKATNKGNFKSEFGIDAECYVLDDPQKTGVISQTGMGRAIGLAPRGNALPRFLASKSMAERLGAELAEKFAKPIKFQYVEPGAEQPPGVIHGYDVTLLIDLCRLIIQAEAEGKLGKRYESVTTQARIILHASAKAGIKQLVYALAGYSPTAQEVISAFKMFVLEEAKKYEKEFPPELYEQWQRLYRITMPERGKPWQFRHLTVKHIYFPLAKSNGRIYQLLKALKANAGDRKTKLFQFLNDIGTRALRMQFGRVLEIAEASENNVHLYEQTCAKRFGDQPELAFDWNEDKK